jgi:hypothetical protein
MAPRACRGRKDVVMSNGAKPEVTDFKKREHNETYVASRGL